MMKIDNLPLKLYRIARMTVDGCSRKHISQSLAISVAEVESARTTIYKTFDVKSRYQLAALVPDAKIKKPNRWPCSDYRASLSMRHEEVVAVNKVLAAAEMGRSIDVMVRDPMYRKARSVLLRSMISIQKKLEAKAG